MKLNGKVVVITGASSGLGLALARVFRESGCEVIASSNNKAGLKKIERELGIRSFAADVTKEKDMANLAGFALEEFGRLDIWINNAGITTPNSDIEKTSVSEARRVMDVNFFGTVYGTFSALKIMRKQKRGTIVNVISVRAFEKYVRPGIYSASKWAARGFTEGLKFVPKPKGVSVVAVYPSAMKTDLWGSKRPAGYKKFMEPESVAKKIAANLKRSNPKKEQIIR